PVSELDVAPANGAALAAALSRALELGRGMVRVAEPPRASDAQAGVVAAETKRKRRAKKGARGASAEAPLRDAGELFSTERSCPSCGRSFEPLDPRLFSYNSRYGWCESCYGTGVRLQGFDEEQT